MRRRRATYRGSSTVRSQVPHSALFTLVFNYAAILWLELMYRAFFVSEFFSRGLLYIAIFALPLAAFMTILCLPWKKDSVRRGFFIGQLALVTFWMLVQLVYRRIFRSAVVLDLFHMAGMALSNYWRETLLGIWNSLPQILLMAVPLLASILLVRNTVQRAEKGLMISAVAVLAVVSVLAELSTFLPTPGAISTREMYRGSFDPNLTITQFGVTTTFKLDVLQTLFGLEEIEDPTPVVDPDPGDDPDPEDDPKPVVYKPNVMDIDFDTLIANETDATYKSMHQYFSQREPTMQNKYTGMFAGKNLIYITAEGFWKYAVSEKYTPTLYKLANEGFVFRHFYNPLGTHSTIDGEFAMCTGMLPSNQMFAFYRTEGNSMYYSLGNMLKEQGYTTRAYHNHYADYYNRDKLHPNLGYDFYAVGRGLTVKMTWPESDLEMMEKSLPQALEEGKPFHLYYMTISGHLNYSFLGNSMASKHKEEVADLDMSEEAKAYLACQMELDRALQYVLEQLEAAGQLENTVIVMGGDHYPYGMSRDTWNEFAGHEIDEVFELPESTLILWSGDMEEPVVVDKYCTSVDVLPTVLNLFGLEYDSRLLMGRDILSDSPSVAVLYNRSFISEYGSYDISKNQFTPAEGVVVPENYVSDMVANIKKMFTYSDRVIYYDYYRKLGLVH